MCAELYDGLTVHYMKKETATFLEPSRVSREPFSHHSADRCAINSLVQRGKDSIRSVLFQRNEVAVSVLQSDLKMVLCHPLYYIPYNIMLN